MENFNRRRSVTHTTLQGIDKTRFMIKKKPKHLLAAEKQAVGKDAPKALFGLVCKPLKQDAKIRSTRNSENLVSMELYRIVGIHIDLYRTTRPTCFDHHSPITWVYTYNRERNLRRVNSVAPLNELRNSQPKINL